MFSLNKLMMDAKLHLKRLRNPPPHPTTEAGTVRDRDTMVTALREAGLEVTRQDEHY